MGLQVLAAAMTCFRLGRSAVSVLVDSSVLAASGSVAGLWEAGWFVSGDREGCFLQPGQIITATSMMVKTTAIGQWFLRSFILYFPL